MFNLRARIERLEKRETAVAGCATCGGQGWPVLVVEQPPLPERRAGGCPSCGREAEKKVIRLSGSSSVWDAL